MPEKIRARQAIVLGASGLLGQALVRRLEESGVPVAAPTHQELDVRDEKALEAYLLARPDHVIYNAVAYTAVDAAEDDQENAQALNARLPAALGRLAARTGAPLVHFSTDFVFDGTLARPYTETDAPNPLNVYGATKLAGERALLALNLPHIYLVRTAWLFGRGKKNFITAILDRCAQYGSARVVADQTGSPTFADDLAAHAIALTATGAGGLYHIVNAGQATWHELACAAVQLKGQEASVEPIAHDAWPTRASRPAWSVLDMGKFTRVTGRAPRHWREALAAYLAG